MTARLEGWTLFRGPEMARCLGPHPDLPGRACAKGAFTLARGSLLYARPRERLWAAAAGPHRPADGPGAEWRCYRCGTMHELVFGTEPITFPTSSTPLPS